MAKDESLKTKKRFPMHRKSLFFEGIEGVEDVEGVEGIEDVEGIEVCNIIN